MTCFEYYKTLSRRFAAAGITEDDALLLILAVLGWSRTDWLMKRENEIPGESLELISAYAARRERREPLQQILGTQSFCGLDFLVTPDVLCPRPDTERLVELALPYCTGRVLDLCTGSGCIGIALRCLGKAESVTASDISGEALKVARENALRNRADIIFLQSDLFSRIEGNFSLIVSNPPYIPKDQMDGLMPEVRDYEPRLALYGGPDGLDYYRRLIPEAFRHLEDGGRLFVEIGFDQGKSVPEFFREAGFSEVGTAKDYAGLDRVVYGVR